MTGDTMANAPKPTTPSQIVDVASAERPSMRARVNQAVATAVRPPTTMITMLTAAAQGAAPK